MQDGGQEGLAMRYFVTVWSIAVAVAIAIVVAVAVAVAFAGPLTGVRLLCNRPIDPCLRGSGEDNALSTCSRQGGPDSAGRVGW